MASPKACSFFGAVVLATVAAPSAFALQATLRVSVDSAGAEGNLDSAGGGISTDGRYVAFYSWATNLVAGDNNNSGDIFVFDRATATTERVSLDSAGYEQVGSSYVWFQCVSGDGSRVAFTSDAAFDPSDTNGFQDVYVRDRAAGTTTLVSVDSAGNHGDNVSFNCAISENGQFVAFTSYATNLVPGDTNGKYDIYVHDLATGATERASVDSSGNEGKRTSEGPSISADGNFVTFCSPSASLVPGDTNSRWDVFVRDRAAGTTERVSVDSTGQEGDDDSMDPSISADGRLVAFMSAATNLVNGDGGHHTDIFVHDRTTGETTRVSVSSAQQQGNANSGTPLLSPDGRFVVFTSAATNLVKGDTNNQWDVFLRDRVQATTTRVSVDSSGAEANLTSWPSSVSTRGDASFSSIAYDLVASDTNAACDVFVNERCSASASWTNYGAGFPGTHGVPSFTLQQFPAFGSTITIDLANSYGQPTIGFLVLGLQRASLPTKWGGDLLVLPTLIAPITFSYGFDSFTGTIPDDVGLCGATIELQGIELDPGAQFGLSFSQGLELEIGN
jgi:hypothetical protein